MHKVTLIKGDDRRAFNYGCGSICRCFGVKINWQEAEAGMSAFDKTGTPLPDATMESIAETKSGV